LLRASNLQQARVTTLMGTSAVEVVLSSRASILFPADNAAEAAEVLDRAKRLLTPAEQLATD
jgi:hypothetical protein